MNIAVYCSSKRDLEQRYIDIAQALGQWLGEHKHTLVFGGVNAGLMHVVAKACHDSGGEVVGVITDNFAHLADSVVDRLITVGDLSQRKSQMYRISDIHVVLPGGVGTIDEWMAALSQWIVDNRNGVGIVIANIDGMYDHLLRQLHQLAATPLAGEKHINSMAVANDAQAMIEKLNELTALQNEK